MWVKRKQVNEMKRQVARKRREVNISGFFEVYIFILIISLVCITLTSIQLIITSTKNFPCLTLNFLKPDHFLNKALILYQVYHDNLNKDRHV